ncbi:MAG: type I-B CRISPR-associated protein Cas7/Cst2/DevR [Methanobacterium sp.]|uniref:type I-B CRISPR-associated protein Cas7/Cst2/DevR n=1 Tax=Methanobacterium sp. TaxID=2164 RepID=UPI003D651BD5|nr:type I-B CRISPR-associated protein Cas7/Cst2/DevR [Methanobacterium sp.]
MKSLKGISVVWLTKTDLTNLNAGEGEESFIDVKKYKIGREEYPYVSGQAMRFYIKEAIRRNLENDSMCIPNSEGIPVCLQEINKLEEYDDKWKSALKGCLSCDLFGFMKPIGSQGSITRVSPVKVAPAIGLLPFDENSTIDFLTRKEGINVSKKQGGKIVNVEIGTNIYKSGISVDFQRVGGEEDWSEGIVKMDYALNEEERKERIKKVIESLRYLTDYSKQARLLTDFTPDIICIAFQNKYSHRLQKLFELNKNEELNISRLNEILSDVKEYSDNIIFGMISGVINNEESVKKVFEDHNIPVKTPNEAINDALSQF